MPGQILDGFNINAALKQLGAKSAPENMGMNALFNPGPLHGLVDSSPYAARRGLGWVIGGIQAV